MLSLFADYEIDIMKIIFAFYLLIYSAELDSIFKCVKIDYISKNVVIKYIVIFLIFFFLVSYVTDTPQLDDINPIEKLIYSIFYFSLFIITLRIDNKIRNIIILLLTITYFLDLSYSHYFYLINKKNPKDEYWITWKYPKINYFQVNSNHLSFINQLNIFIIKLIYILIAVGFVLYLNEIKKLRNKKISWFDIIFNNYCVQYDKNSLLK